MNKLMRYDPFAELTALQKQFFGDDWLSPFKGVNIPTTDVYTDGDKQLVVEAHLPNFQKEDVDISINDGSLVIQAGRHENQAVVLELGDVVHHGQAAHATADLGGVVGVQDSQVG